VGRKLAVPTQLCNRDAGSARYEESTVRLVGVLRALVVTVILAGLAGCSTATPASTSRPGTSVAQPPAATPAGQPSTAEGLCGTFTEDLALAALGEPVAEPTGGDGVPRPNGIYCHYAASADANTNVEAQLKDMTRDEFEEFEGTIDGTRPLAGVGEAAFQRESSIMGLGGAFVAAWSGGRGVTVSINREDGDQAAMSAAAQQIAAKVLLAP
jgi:hypothetical protein